MTKAEMVDAVAAGLTKKAAAAALEAVTEAIATDLKKGNSVVITGFGTFRVSKRAPPAPASTPEPLAEDQDPSDESPGV